MNIQPISQNQLNFYGQLKLKKINVYDINTGELISKIDSEKVDTKNVVSMVTAFLSKIKEDSEGINTLIQVMQDDKKCVYYGVPQGIAEVTKAYLRVKNSNKTVRV